jgi:hypothetical protein
MHVGLDKAQGRDQKYTSNVTDLFWTIITFCYYICPTNAQYINNIYFFKHSYMFLCFYAILSEFLIM